MRWSPVFLLAPLTAGVALMLTSCEAADNIPAYTARQMAEVIVASQSELPPLSVMTPEEDHFAERVDNIYLLDSDVVRDGAVFYSEGSNADEIAVFQLAEGSAPDEVETALMEYMEQRAATFTGYFPAEAAEVENSAVALNGGYVALLICKNPADAKAAFLACFSDAPPALPKELSTAPEPTESESTEPAEPAMAPRTATETEKETEPTAEASSPADGYDHDAILAAWESGDRDSLTERDREILDICADVIDENITEDMADDEKELMIHDWIAEWVAYDDALMSNGPDVEPTPDNDNPYGALVYQTAQCEGYTLTFQLFMDMLGIECITVYGTNLWGYEEHSWNMVRLEDGEWYCVDVTWDDTSDVTTRIYAPTNHKYFNVTSDFMFQNDHQWDRTAVPEATSTRFQ